jgi:hypothetical protein
MAMSLKFKGMRLLGSLATAAALWVGAGAAQAAFSTAFSIGNPIYPDLYAEALSLSYSSPSDFATASTLTIGTTGGTFFTWTEDSTATPVGLGASSFSLTANFSSNGSVFTGGNLEIFGGGGLSIDPGTLLLSANIFDFAIDRQDDENGTFFFRLNNTASNASSQLGWDVPNDGQVIFNANTISNSAWADGAVAFTAGGTADTGVRVPTPATIALLGLGLIGMRSLRVRRAGTRSER